MTKQTVLGVAREVVVVVVLAAVLSAAMHAVLETVRVEGFSMETTLDDHDYLVATTIDYRLHGPSRGDIVVVVPSQRGQRNLIKRVVGLPGDHLVVRGTQVCIDRRPLGEPYLNADLVDGSASAQVDEIIPPGQYFVMGDNRGNSLDSRSFGPVSAGRIEAHAWLRLLPLARLGPVGGAPPTLSAPGAPCL
jgi:signal peptidase I